MRQTDGFSVVELMMVMILAVILMAMAIPALSVNDRVRVDTAAREIQQELHAARLRAVGTNRRLEVRLNCPSAGQYRVVEAGWPDSGRCDPVTYPYPAPPDAAYRVPAKPRLDGPIRYLNNRVSLSSSSGTLVFQFLSNGQAMKGSGGSAAPIALGGETLTLSIGSYSRRVNVNGLGKVLLQ